MPAGCNFIMLTLKSVLSWLCILKLFLKCKRKKSNATMLEEIQI